MCAIIREKFDYFIICDYLYNRLMNHKMCSPLFCFLLHLAECGFPTRTKLVAPTVETQSLNHRTTRDAFVPHYSKTRKVNGVIN